MNQNTTPVVIQDKNGKTTTVHRKNDSQGPSSASSLPAPALGAAGALTTEQALSKLNEYGVDLEDSRYGKGNIDYLSSAYPRVMNQLLEAVSEAEPDTLPVWTYRLGEKLMHDEHADEHADDEEYETEDHRNSYYRMIKIIPFSRKLFPDEDPAMARNRVERLTNTCERKMGWRPMQKNYTEVQAAMIAAVASGKLDSFEFKGRMDDIFWMADNLKKVETVLPEIMERGDSSRGYIEAVLENKASALVDGVL